MGSEGKEPQLGLRQVTWKRFLRGPDAQLLDELYLPALSRAVRYDRCCAYFNSQVLAVAARGFGGFIENLLTLGEGAARPAARLLVNEQLDREDLDALLATGDQALLIDHLLKQFKTPKAALERNRLEMLAWLVASGWLEVRVGLMRRSQGVLHAKFGLVTDAHGDCVAFSGSDNETGQALTENYEELQLGTSWQDGEFVSYYRQRFESLWADEDENVAVLPLPEAVRQELIKLAPPVPPCELLRDKDSLVTAMLWHYLAAAAYLPNGEQACDATALVDLWPHQRRVVEDVAGAFPAGRLLCDEVGLGKTVEAILVLRRLLAGRGARRALLLVPAGLLKQWQDELREKGGLVVPRWEDGSLAWPDGRHESMLAAQALRQENLLLLSREWARLPDNRNLVLAAPAWDVVLLDEAHAARRRQPDETQFNMANLLLALLRELQLRRRARGLLLLSATPMQTQPWEPWDLLGVLGVGGRWLVEFKDIRAYYEGIVKLGDSSLLMPEARAIAALVSADPEFPPPPDGDLASSLSAKSLANALAFGPAARRKPLAAWLRKGAPLGRYMHRNTRETLRRYHARGLSAYRPPKRDVRDEVFDYAEQAERDCYEAIEQYIDRRYEELEHEKAGKGFVMTIYRRRAASSPYALRLTLQRRLEAVEAVLRQRKTAESLSLVDEQLDLRDLSDADIDERIDLGLPQTQQGAESEHRQIQALLERLNSLGATDSKLARFLDVLAEVTADGRSALVFSEYTDTMTYLRDQLRPMYGTALACYSGAGGQVWDGKAWQPVSKAEITERLARGQLKVLVCTDAASEGLNLQAASALINYDLPWNPSKVEQRIGRIDRIGQEQSLLPIRNLFLANSVDMEVYRVLQTRCGLFKRFVGPMQPVLAKARDLLRTAVGLADVKSALSALQAAADIAEGDAAVTSVFSEADAEVLPTPVPACARADIELALARLGSPGGGLGAKRIKGSRRWRLTGLGRRVEVTIDRETLERDRKVMPLTPVGELLEEVARRLVLPASAPLVIAEWAAGAYRCLEARWVHGDGRAEEVQTASQLLRLAEQWDGSMPPLTALKQAEDEARIAARARVQRLEAQARATEEAGLRRQVEAARLRLLRELGRTLRCYGSGDLNAILRKRLEVEPENTGRFRRALAQLGCFPQWTPEELQEIEEDMQRMSDEQRRGRALLGSELEAALNDPRWEAEKALG